jgi:hypothetical protein
MESLIVQVENLPKIASYLKKEDYVVVRENGYLIKKDADWTRK